MQPYTDSYPPYQGLGQCSLCLCRLEQWRLFLCGDYRESSFFPIGTAKLGLGRLASPNRRRLIAAQERFGVDGQLVGTTASHSKCINVKKSLTLWTSIYRPILERQR